MLPRVFPLFLLISSMLFGSAVAAEEHSLLQPLCTTTAVLAARKTIQQTPLWHILVEQRDAIELLFNNSSQKQLRDDNQFIRNTLAQTYSLIFDATNQYLHDIQEPLTALLQTTYVCQPRVTPELTQLLELLETLAVQATLICPQTNDETIIQKTLYGIIAALRRLVLSAPLTQAMATMSADVVDADGGLKRKDAANLAAQFNAVAKHLKATGAYDRWEKEKKKDSWFVRLLKMAAIAGVVYTAWRWWYKKTNRRHHHPPMTKQV